MADLTVTAANVVRGTGLKQDTGIAGVAITAGQTLYKDATDGNKLKLADADSATAGQRTSVGVALNSAAIGQPVAYGYDGPISIGATVAVGVVYVQSDTPGGIMPAGDLETGDFVTVVGIGISTSQIKLGLLASGVAFA